MLQLEQLSAFMFIHGISSSSRSIEGGQRDILLILAESASVFPVLLDLDEE